MKFSILEVEIENLGIPGYPLCRVPNFASFSIFFFRLRLASELQVHILEALKHLPFFGQKMAKHGVTKMLVPQMFFN